MTTKNLIKAGTVVKVDDDQSAFPFSQVKYDKKVIQFYELTPYSIYSKCPTGPESWATHFPYNGIEENRAGIANVFSTRYKGLKEGEAIHGNTLTGTHQYYKQNGDLDIEVKGNQNINVTGNGTVTVGGNVTVVVQGQADITVTGNTTVTTPLTTFNGNVHINGVLSGDSGGAGSHSLVGDINVTGTIDGSVDVTSQGISLNSHTHPGDSGGNTGPPQ
jgi:hypothetical protein